MGFKGGELMSYRSRSRKNTKKIKYNFKGLLRISLLFILIAFILLTYRTVSLVSVLGGRDGYFHKNLSGRENYLIVYEREGLETLFIISVDKNQAYFIDIPVNSRVDSHGQRIMLKELFESAEIEGLISAVDYIFSRNISLDNYIIIRDEGLNRLIDKMRGIQIYIPEPLDFGSIIYMPGRRNFTSKDFSNFFSHVEENNRTSYIPRQINGLQSAFNQYLRWNRSIILASGLTSMEDYFSTNMTLRELAWFRNMLDELDLSSGHFITVPGRTETIIDRDFWIIDTERASRVLQKIEDNEPVVSKEDITINVLNGNGIRGIAGRFSNIIMELGFTNVTANNADHSNYEKTIIRYPQKYLSFAQELATILSDTVQFEEIDDDTITIILGRDIN